MNSFDVTELHFIVNFLGRRLCAGLSNFEQHPGSYRHQYTHRLARPLDCQTASVNFEPRSTTFWFDSGGYLIAGGFGSILNVFLSGFITALSLIVSLLFARF